MIFKENYIKEVINILFDSKEVKCVLDEISESRNFIKALDKMRVKKFVTNIIEGKVRRWEDEKGQRRPYLQYIEHISR